jgi:hypothetical protein
VDTGVLVVIGATMATPLERLVLICNERLSEEEEETETLEDPSYRHYEPRWPVILRARSPIVYRAKDGWRCEGCHTEETPQRRRGPGGAKSMCNACGLRWIKRRRREGEEPPAEKRGPRVKKCATFGTCYETVLGEEDYKRLKHKRYPLLKDSYDLSMGWDLHKGKYDD